jgi:flavin-dependent dehydrogenase
MYDVIVVGARCAGATLGNLLSCAGLRVLLVDKAAFPSDALSTHMIHESGIARLLRWDSKLVEAIRASDCPSLVSSTTDLGEFSYSADHLPAGGNREAFCPRRTVLDKLLVDAATSVGCQLWTDFTVRGVVREGDRVVGIRGSRRGGPEVVENARFVVGADGRRSLVAKEVQAAEYNTRPITTCTYYTYWANTAVDRTIISPRENRAVVAVPTNDGLVVITAIFPIGEFSAVKKNIESSYQQALATSPVLMSRMCGSRRAERYFGTADLPFYYRTGFGPGWALVGDAGHHKDPIIARGISDAFLDAEGLSRALVEGLSGSQPLEEALGEWVRERDRVTGDIYDMTYRLSLLRAPSPMMTRVYEAARTNARIASRFHGVISGTLAYADFFCSQDIDQVLLANS